MTRRLVTALALAAAASATGCLMGPNYRRPDVAVPDRFRETDAAAAPALDADWWKLFGDPALTELEEQARDANQDLQLAMARVAEERSIARIAKSDFFPIVTLDPSRTVERLSANRPASSSAQIEAKTTSETSVPFDLTYEIDLWGRVRRSFESATASAHAAADDYGVVALTLAADVAQQYFALRSLDAQLAILHDNIDVFRENVRLVESRYAAGLVSELDRAQARTQLATTIATEADARLARADTEHALAVLCGQPASEFAVAPRAVAIAPPAVPAGLPSQLLERRPDVVEAEHRLVAANADVGVADALFFPQVRIVGTAGLESADAGDLLKWESRIWSIGPSVSAPIFEGGRLRANQKAAVARWDQAVASYRQAVLGAFRDVEDALSGVALRAVQRDAQAKAVEEAARAVEVARSQYVHGITDYLQVIVAQATSLSLELEAQQIEQQQLDASVLLVKAIGGGWQ